MSDLTPYFIVNLPLPNPLRRTLVITVRAAQIIQKIFCLPQHHIFQISFAVCFRDFLQRKWLDLYRSWLMRYKQKLLSWDTRFKHKLEKNKALVFRKQTSGSCFREKGTETIMPETIPLHLVMMVKAYRKISLIDTGGLFQMKSMYYISQVMKSFQVNHLTSFALAQAGEIEVFLYK